MVFFEKCNVTQIAEIKFLQQLAEELRAKFMEEKQAPGQVEQGGPPTAVPGAEKLQ